jgi:hypothetical protein
MRTYATYGLAIAVAFAASMSSLPVVEAGPAQEEQACAACQGPQEPLPQACCCSVSNEATDPAGPSWTSPAATHTCPCTSRPSGFPWAPQQPVPALPVSNSGKLVETVRSLTADLSLDAAHAGVSHKGSTCGPAERCSFSSKDPPSFLLFESFLI